MNGLKEIIVSVVFMAILILPMADSVFHFIPDVKNTENRAFKTMPEFDITFMDLFPEAFDEYYTDNFDLRNQFIWFNSKLKYRLFNIPPVQGKAFIGKAGWMYLIKDEMDIYLGNNLADENKLTRYYDIFNYRKNFLDSIGCKYYVAIVPIKTSVYPEFLPLAKSKAVQLTLTDQLVNVLDTVKGLTLIDLRHVFNESKSVRVFHKTDNHWNDYGSYIAYESIISIISNDFPELSPPNPISKFNVDSVESHGRLLTNMMGIYDEVNEIKITCEPTFIQKSKKGEKSNYPVMRGFPYTTEYELVYTTSNDSLPKMLMIRDSFGKTIIPFLSEHFSKSVYIFDGWHHGFDEDIVLNEKPDIFIQLVLESFIPNVYKHAKKPVKVRE